MNKSLLLKTLLLCFVTSCQISKQESTIKSERYEITLAKKQKSVLIVFPCYPCDIEHTKKEASFLKDIENQGITTILMNYNQKLFLTDAEKTSLSAELYKVFKTYEINSDNIYLGGFSSGGNTALLIGDYIKGQQSELNIKGVFAVDAPVDLEQLYYNAKNDIALNANEDAKLEGELLADLLEKEVGNPAKPTHLYKQFSPFLLSQNYLGNLPNQKNYKIRLYTEPSPEWQKVNRKREYENTNSWMNERFYEALSRSGNTSCEIIKTENKGVRANGDVHPHSWSIVEQQDLLKWMQ